MKTKDSKRRNAGALGKSQIYIKNKNKNVINIKINTHRKRREHSKGDRQPKSEMKTRTEIIHHYSTPQLQMYQPFNSQPIKQQGQMLTNQIGVTQGNAFEQPVRQSIGVGTEPEPIFESVSATPLRSLDVTATPLINNNSNELASDITSKQKTWDDFLTNTQGNTFANLNVTYDSQDDENILNTLMKNNMDEVRFEKRFDEYETLRLQVEKKKTYKNTRAKFKKNPQLMESEIERLKEKNVEQIRIGQKVVLNEPKKKPKQKINKG
jgi:hypothetical protein